MCTQELQNSILDLTRRLREAADKRATMTAVARQREAEVARCQAEAAAAAEAAAERARQLAVTTTQLKVWRSHPSTATRLGVTGGRLRMESPLFNFLCMQETGESCQSEANRHHNAAQGVALPSVPSHACLSLERDSKWQSTFQSTHLVVTRGRLWMGSNFSNGCKIARLQESSEHSKYLEASNEHMGIADLPPLDKSINTLMIPKCLCISSSEAKWQTRWLSR